MAEKFTSDLEKFKSGRVERVKRDIEYHKQKLKELEMMLKIWSD